LVKEELEKFKTNFVDKLPSQAGMPNVDDMRDEVLSQVTADLKRIMPEILAQWGEGYRQSLSNLVNEAQEAFVQNLERGQQVAVANLQQVSQEIGEDFARTAREVATDALARMEKSQHRFKQPQTTFVPTPMPSQHERSSSVGQAPPRDGGVFASQHVGSSMTPPGNSGVHPP
jgi:hypothetical protein